jgi:hypothetical protein
LRILEGKGRWLMPALWDLKASAWGNESAKNYDELTQEMGIAQCMRVQLYYGVAHVGSFGLSREWASRELRRAHAMEFPAAELLFPDKALCGTGQKSFACVGISAPAELGPLLDGLKRQGVPFIELFYGDPKSKFMPGLSRPLLEAALAQARERGLLSYVLVNDWRQAEEAVRLGAAAIQGLPMEPVPDALIELMRERKAAYAPALAGFLELPRILGNAAALRDPFLSASVPPEILDTFRDPNALWEGFRGDLEHGKRALSAALATLQRMEAGGVPLLTATDTGWVSGTFHGYSVHAVQQWMQRAGLDPWTRLRAATLWPARLAGRSVGFAAGMPADFLVLDADPLEKADHLRRISLVIREGRVVERESLKPDLSRGPYRAR